MMNESDLRIMIDDAVRRSLDSHVDEIAQKVEQRLYARVGTTMVQQLLKLIGIVTVAAALWLAGKGYISQ